MKQQHFKKGETLILLLVMIFLFSVVMLPIINLTISKSRVLSLSVDREKALQIAEAGINYYQWHLAHYPSDYKDGNATSTGPYVHPYVDFDTAQTIGNYSLVITPPAVGSTIVTIQSTGTVTGSGATATITAKYGIPSLAQYSFLSNDIIWIGDSETVSGQLQSNNGVRFDGVGNAPIQSAKSTYTCSSNQGSPCPALKNGVWGNASQAVKNFWQFPVPAVDFSSLTSNLATLKSQAQSGGIYLAPSNKEGYLLRFNSDGTVTIYKVNKRISTPTGWDVQGNAHNEDTDYNPSTSGGNAGLNILSGYPKTLPSNGIIYVEDNIWVEGTVHGRVMVAAAKLPYSPSTAPTIYISNNIVYSAKDGTDVLGLLSQKDIVVTYFAPGDLEIDAALISQNGSAQLFYYGAVKSNPSTITVYGSIMSYGQWTWSWVNSSGSITSGYKNTIDNYDGNLLYSPPPSFPLSTAGYQQLNWVSK